MTARAITVPDAMSIEVLDRVQQVLGTGVPMADRDGKRVGNLIFRQPLGVGRALSIHRKSR
jgi:hypothetical protein